MDHHLDRPAVPPLDLVTRRMSIRYAPDWTPLGLEIDAVSRGSTLAIQTAVTGSSAASDVTQLGQTIQKSDPITKGALLLPNMFFASFEALALRLSALTEESARFTAYIVPQAEIQIAVRRLGPETIETQQRALQARRFAVTFMNPGKPLESEVWIDENGRLLRFSVVTQGLAVIREDVSSVTTRRQNITRAGDETVRIPANGFNLVGTLSKAAGSPDAKGRYPAVIMVAGSGPTDRDETVAGIPVFGQMAGMLAEAGFVVVRYDKRGVGQSGGRSESATLADYAEDVLAVRRFLSRRKDVDDRRIAIFGHSEGAAVALIAASRDKEVAAVDSCRGGLRSRCGPRPRAAAGCARGQHLLRGGEGVENRPAAAGAGRRARDRRLERRARRCAATGGHAMVPQLPGLRSREGHERRAAADSDPPG